MGVWLSGLGAVRRYWSSYDRLAIERQIKCKFSESYLTSNGLHIGRTTTLGLFVTVLLVGYMLVDLVVGEDSSLGLKNLHADG